MTSTSHEEEAPMARHMVWSESYMITYQVDPHSGSGFDIKSMKVVHNSWLPTMAAIELDDACYFEAENVTWLTIPD